MTNRRLKVRLQIQDQSIRQEFARVISTIDGFDIHSSGEAGTADLLILQVGDQPEEVIGQAQQALRSGIVGNVFLTSKIVKHEVLIEAMRAGVREFFTYPLKTEDIKKALARIREEQASVKNESLKKQGVIINTLGTKGGIGTTTVAVNLATSLAGIDHEKSVALIDMNLLFGEIPMFLGIESMFDWVEVAKNVYRLDSTYLMDVMSPDRSGVRVLPSPARVLDEFRVTPTVVETLLIQIRSMFDYTVIDSGQSLDDISKTIIRIADHQLIVTLLSLPCLVNVKRLQDAFRKFGYPPDEHLKILVNRYQKHSVITIENAQESLNKKIFWALPNDFHATMTAINQGKPLNVIEPHAEITESFREMAAIFAGRPVKKKSILPWKWKTEPAFTEIS